VSAPDAQVAAERRVRHRFLHTPGAGGRAVQRLTELLAEEYPLWSPQELRARATTLAAELVGLGPLQSLLDDPAVTDVLVNGPGEVWVERDGRLEPSGVHLDVAAIERDVERLVAPLGLRADRTHPIVDARLDDGTRVTVVLPPLAVDGPLLAIRRHVSRTVPLEDFAPAEVAQLLADLVRHRCNIGVYGPTGAGKTTLLNALLSCAGPGERIVTIEDVAELRVPGDHVVRLEARPGTAEGVGRASIRDLVRAALRLRPDRLVMGEVRGAEALDMVWALGTGHDGSLATWHAGSAADALARLETLCAFGDANLPLAAIRAQIRTAFDVLIGVGRVGDGRRAVRAVHALDDAGRLRELTRPRPGEA